MSVHQQCLMKLQKLIGCACIGDCLNPNTMFYIGEKMDKKLPKNFGKVKVNKNSTKFAKSLDKIKHVNDGITHSNPQWTPSPREDGRMEWICEHGVGHGEHIHGCDVHDGKACCQRDSYPRDYHAQMECILQDCARKGMDVAETLVTMCNYSPLLAKPVICTRKGAKVCKTSPKRTQKGAKAVKKNR